MGSSTGRRSSGKRGGSSDRISACDSVSIEALLASPQTETLAKVAINSVVTIRLDTATGRSIVKVWLGDELLGSLTVTGLDKLIECLQKGYPFHGIVLEVKGAFCKIWIRSGEAS
jgi:hypothetical protein